jgi:hypothetical protein
MAAKFKGGQKENVHIQHSQSAMRAKAPQENAARLAGQVFIDLELVH